MLNSYERPSLPSQNALEQSLVSSYGEATTKTTAAKILSKHPNTIKQMLQDGRLIACCAGSRVYVRSIAAYIATPKQIEFNAKVRKRIRNGKGRFMV